MANQVPKNWQTEVRELLAHAAQICVEHDVEMEPFMRGASGAYLDARPGMREHLEEQQLKAKLAELRDSGRMAEA